MKKIFNKDLKNILKTIIQFLTFIFLVVFISAAIMGKGEYNPLQMALYFTSFFGGFAFICIFIYTLFDYLTERYIIENIRNGKVENANQLKNIIFEYSVIFNQNENIIKEYKKYY